jgi:hypothetical protein
MLRRPFFDETGCVARQSAFDDFACVDGDVRFELTLDRVEVRRQMLSNIHADVDAVEIGNRRQTESSIVASSPSGVQSQLAARLLSLRDGSLSSSEITSRPWQLLPTTRHQIDFTQSSITRFLG